MHLLYPLHLFIICLWLHYLPLTWLTLSSHLLGPSWRVVVYSTLMCRTGLAHASYSQRSTRLHPFDLIYVYLSHFHFQLYLPALVLIRCCIVVCVVFTRIVLLSCLCGPEWCAPDRVCWYNIPLSHSFPFFLPPLLSLLSACSLLVVCVHVLLSFLHCCCVFLAVVCTE
jgi:hypothetical protein